MPAAKAEAERVLWLIKEGKIPPDEPCKLVLPRVDAKDRIKNPDKAKRIIFACDQTTKEEFGVWREAWLSKLNNNPTMFGLALIEAMKTFDILQWLEDMRQDQIDAGPIMRTGDYYDAE